MLKQHVTDTFNGQKQIYIYRLLKDSEHSNKNYNSYLTYSDIRNLTLIVISQTQFK